MIYRQQGMSRSNDVSTTISVWVVPISTAWTWSAHILAMLLAVQLIVDTLL